MVRDCVLERYLDALLQGDRTRCRAVIEETLQTGTPANSVYVDVIWPIMVEIEKLWRADKISRQPSAKYQLGCREFLGRL